MAKRICIIGAGISGLTALKSCLEDGLDAVCYEKTNCVGGLWKYREESVEGVGSVMKSTILNTSKEMSAYSDFPPPKHFPNFMHNSLLLQYLNMYADNFHLRQRIHFEHEVQRVEKAKDYDTSGRWNITVKDKNAEATRITYDAVFICTGHHVYPNIPKFPGLSDFQGPVLHARDYKTDTAFQDKRVLVIGIGNSGGDIAVELSRVAQQVYLSTRRGAWVLSRMAEGGWPLDIKYKSRFYSYLFHYTSWYILNTIAEAKANFRCDHTVYSLKPKHRFFSQHPMVNDDLPSRISTGAVIIRDDILRFTKTGVVFKDDDELEMQIDAVVLATGYKIEFPFLEDGIIQINKNHVKLYKYVFPTQLRHPTLAVIGLLQVLGSLPPLAEIQSRWASKVFKGQCRLPNEFTMLQDIERKQLEIALQYFDSERHTLQVDFVWFQDEIAQLIDVKPDFRNMFFSDPELFWACMFGPCLPYQFRLVGSGRWSGAREAILTAKDRVLTPLRTRRISQSLQTIHPMHSLFVVPIYSVIFAIIATIVIVMAFG